MDDLVLGGHRFTSRLVVGTGKYKDFPTMKAALEASGAQMVTVAVRRLDLTAKGEASLLHWIPKEMVLLPNTAGCYTADDAVRTCRLARELQRGGDAAGRAHRERARAAQPVLAADDPRPGQGAGHRRRRRGHGERLRALH